MIREREYHGLPGIPVLIALLLVEAGLVWALVRSIQAENPVGISLVAIGLALVTFLLFGLFMVHPEPGQGAAVVRRSIAGPRRCRGCAGRTRF